jgi:2-polyprenyl-3-methyl-5-hydroxy-6-metoxy-1,4-benzoquinol methylase
MVMDATADIFPLGDQSFDIVICCELYEHLDAAQGIVLLVNARKALKENGRLLFIAPINEEIVLSIKGFVFGILGKGEIQSDWTHKRSLSLDEIIDVLRKNGFTDIKWRARNAHGKFVSTLVDFISIIPYLGKRFMGSAVVVGFKDNKMSGRIQKN